MKRTRLIALLLAAVLLLSLLSGCELPGKAKDRPKKTEAPTDSPAPAEPTEPAAPSARTVEAGGVKLRLDESRYAAYSPPEEKYTRLSDGPLTEFVPSLSYGTVFPYVAGRLYASSKEGYTWNGGCSYGLADSEGRLLTDGICTSAHPLSRYAMDEVRYLPFLVISRQLDAERISHDGGEWTEIRARTESALIAMDGSFMIPFSDCYFYGFPDCIIAFSRGEQPQGPQRQDSFVVYDFSGEPLFFSTKLRIDPQCDDLDVTESEGMLRVCQRYYSGDFSTRSVTDYYDLTGRHVLGPYQQGGEFSEGLACVSEDGVHYGYIGSNGEWVIAPKYLYQAEFSGGRVIQSTGEGAYVLLDTAGRELLHLRGMGVYLMSGMICVHGNYSGFGSANYNQYYDLDGNLLYEGFCSVEPLTETVFCIYDEQNMEVRVEDRLHPERSVTLSGIDYGFTACAVLLDGQLRLGVSAWDPSRERFLFIDQDTLEAVELPRDVRPFEYTEDEMHTGYEQDPVTGETWYLVREKNRWVLFDAERNLRFRFVSTDFPVILGGCVRATDASACTIYDTEGNVVFRRHLDAED